MQDQDYKEELGIIGGTCIAIAGIIAENPTAVLGGIVIVGGITGVKVFRGKRGL